ncbi:DNA primase [Ignicoccus pacificus DSM 13166]|uniref:DNA primase large subunit PriL n=1 Tax=Ignicoccus pacificus DSM 13166 TaxID=940294 RepID=A0A977PKJ8_9CREN|nr:DNA primase [Ignicoccus pacificus DSM 13166]
MIYSKYPFIADLSKVSRIIFGEELDATELLDMVPEGIEKAKNLLERAIGKTKEKYKCDELCTVLGYKLAIIIAAALDDKWLKNKLANEIATEAYDNFSKDDLGVVVNVLRIMGYDVETLSKPLSVPVRVYKGSTLSEVYPARMSLPTYVSLATRFLSDAHWKVVNKALVGGFVYLKPEEVVRLAQEAVYKKVVNDINEIGRIDVEALPDKIREIVEELAKEVRRGIQKKRKISVEVQGLVPEALPPCISLIYRRALDGENLSHQERFTLATFLLNVGLDVDEVLEVFSRAPDFNERIARYQVEHLAGLRGSRTKYSPPSCRTLFSWNLCPGKEECKKNHPLSEYKRRLWLLRKKSKGRDSGESGEGDVQGSKGGSRGIQRVDGKSGKR